MLACRSTPAITSSAPAKHKGSTYAELNGSFELHAGFPGAPHGGHLKVANLGVASYTDYALTVTKDLGSGFSVGAAVRSS